MTAHRQTPIQTITFIDDNFILIKFTLQKIYFLQMLLRLELIFQCFTLDCTIDKHEHGTRKIKPIAVRTLKCHRCNYTVWLFSSLQKNNCISTIWTTQIIRHENDKISCDSQQIHISEISGNFQLVFQTSTSGLEKASLFAVSLKGEPMKSVAYQHLAWLLPYLVLISCDGPHLLRLNISIFCTSWWRLNTFNIAW